MARLGKRDALHRNVEVDQSGFGGEAQRVAGRPLATGAVPSSRQERVHPPPSGAVCYGRWGRRWEPLLLPPLLLPWCRRRGKPPRVCAQQWASLSGRGFMTYRRSVCFALAVGLHLVMENKSPNLAPRIVRQHRLTARPARWVSVDMHRRQDCGKQQLCHIVRCRVPMLAATALPY